MSDRLHTILQDNIALVGDALGSIVDIPGISKSKCIASLEPVK